MPAALALNVKHNGIVHRRVVLLKVTTERTPRVDEENRVKVTLLSSGFGWSRLYLVSRRSQTYPPRFDCTLRPSNAILTRPRSSSVERPRFRH